MVGIRSGFGDKAVAKDVGEDFLDVVWMDRALAIQEGGGLGGSLQGEGGTGRDGVVLSQDGPDGLAKGEEVALQGVRYRDAAGLGLKSAKVVERDHLGSRVRPGFLTGMVAKNFELGPVIGQAHGN